MTRALLVLLLVPLPLLFSKVHAADAAEKIAFARVENATMPSLDNLYHCSVAEIEVMKVGRSQRAVSIPRDSYCRFLLSLQQSSPELSKSSAAFRKSRGDGNNHMAPLLDVLAILARLKAGSSDISALPAAVSLINCKTAEFVNVHSCKSILDAAALWLDRSAKVENSPWPAWIAARSQLDAGQWGPASESLIIVSRLSSPPATLAELLGPKRDFPGLEAKAAFVQFMLGHFDVALVRLDRVLAAEPNDATSLFLRSRIRDEFGLTAPALIDLQAAAQADPDGLYPAILLIRQGKLENASAALAKLPQSAPDLTAWKLLAVGCSMAEHDPSSAFLATTPMFPKGAAARMALACGLENATTLPQLLALEPRLLAVEMATDQAAAREKISVSYLQFGLDAEDRQDGASATVAYQHALTWSATNTRARFNLAALYIEAKSYDLAEREYRALLAGDPSDHEAQFWLAQSILVARPDEARKMEACGLLQKAALISDSAKSKEFSAAIASYCR